MVPTLQTKCEWLNSVHVAELAVLDARSYSKHRKVDHNDHYY